VTDTICDFLKLLHSIEEWTVFSRQKLATDAAQEAATLLI
jgi:hypothetical protein